MQHLSLKGIWVLKSYDWNESVFSETCAPEKKKLKRIAKEVMEVINIKIKQNAQNPTAEWVADKAARPGQVYATVVR